MMTLSQNWRTLQRVEGMASQENEVVLYHGNQTVLTAERGITFGFLKLLYNAEVNNGYATLVGVRPRGDPLHKVISAHNVILEKEEYDLIITDQVPQAYSPGANASTVGSPRQTSNMQQFFGQFPAANFIFSNQKLLPQISPSIQNQQFPQPAIGGIPQMQMPLEMTPSNSAIDCSLMQGQAQLPISESHLLGSGCQSAARVQETPSTVTGKDAKNNVLLTSKVPQAKQLDGNVQIVAQVAPENSGHLIMQTQVQDEIIETAQFPFHCETCHIPFKSQSKFEYHKRRHTEANPYSCSYCSECFKNYSELSKHREEQHLSNKTFKCMQCTKSFSTKKELSQHMWRHTGINLYKCEICDKEYTTAGNLIMHQQKHKGVKSLRCSLCPKTFAHKTILEGHISCAHTGERPYICRFCSKSFPTNSQLSSHEKKHSDIKPYKCKDCGKTFRQSHVLKRHLKVHTNEKPYKCHVCRKGFRNSFNLRCHKRTHMNVEDRCIVCPLCGKTVRIGRGVKRHLQLYHNEECANEYEAKIFMKSLKLEKVVNGISSNILNGDGVKKVESKMNKNIFNCQKCDESFTSMKCLENHKNDHFEKEKDLIKPKEATVFSCDFCGKTFGRNHILKRHLKIHTNERPHKCDMCHKSFRNSFNLQYHKKTHLSKADRCIACPLCSKTIVKGRGAKRHLQLYHAMECANEDEAENTMKSLRTKFENEKRRISESTPGISDQSQNLLLSNSFINAKVDHSAEGDEVKTKVRKVQDEVPIKAVKSNSRFENCKDSGKSIESKNKSTEISQNRKSLVESLIGETLAKGNANATRTTVELNDIAYENMKATEEKGINRDVQEQKRLGSRQLADDIHVSRSNIENVPAPRTVQAAEYHFRTRSCENEKRLDSQQTEATKSGGRQKESAENIDKLSGKVEDELEKAPEDNNNECIVKGLNSTRENENIDKANACFLNKINKMEARQETTAAKHQSSFEIISRRISLEASNETGCGDCDHANTGKSFQKKDSSSNARGCLEKVACTSNVLRALKVENFDGHSIPVLKKGNLTIPFKFVVNSQFTDRFFPIISVDSLPTDPPSGFSYAFLPVLFEDKLKHQLEKN